MGVTPSLVEFLRARLADRERDAGNAGARFDPAVLLAEVDAKRRIIDWAIKTHEQDYAPWNEELLQLLALPYVAHPEYREEWKL